LLVTDMDHAWSGGAAAGSFADTRGPGATKTMWTFFYGHLLGHSDRSPTVR
jgi:poly(3-hydroxybutyrate) depolymerase